MANKTNTASGVDGLRTEGKAGQFHQTRHNLSQLFKKIPHNVGRVYHPLETPSYLFPP